MDDRKEFHKTMIRHIPPDTSLTTQESTEAFHNLAGFMGVLFRINERTGLIKPETNRKEVPHEDK